MTVFTAGSSAGRSQDRPSSTPWFDSRESVTTPDGLLWKSEASGRSPYEEFTEVDSNLTDYILQRSSLSGDNGRIRPSSRLLYLRESV